MNTSVHCYAYMPMACFRLVNVRLLKQLNYIT